MRVYGMEGGTNTRLLFYGWAPMAQTPFVMDAVSEERV